MYHYCKFMKSFATWQHRFDVDLNFLSYSAPLFRPKCNQFIMLVVVITSPNFLEIIVISSTQNLQRAYYSVAMDIGAQLAHSLMRLTS